MKRAGLILLSIALAGTGAGQSPPALPEGPGKELVEAVCTACHTLERVAAKRATKAEWQDKVL